MRIDVDLIIKLAKAPVVRAVKYTTWPYLPLKWVQIKPERAASQPTRTQASARSGLLVRGAASLGSVRS